jgi:hypothetical protein
MMRGYCVVHYYNPKDHKTDCYMHVVKASLYTKTTPNIEEVTCKRCKKAVTRHLTCSHKRSKKAPFEGWRRCIDCDEMFEG